MKVTYRANGFTADLSDDAARTLVDAGICDVLEPMPEPEQPKRRKAR